MILAAGFGKRMLPLTKNTPKPLIKINGITLLENTINFLKKLGCKQILINSHYKYKQIFDYIESRKDKKIFNIIYEDEILDTGGAIKNALPLIKNDNLLVINSDIFWQKNNLIDAKLLINDYFNKKKPHLLLVKKNNAFGLIRNIGDFNLDNKKIIRFTKGHDIIYYSGFQILNPLLLNLFSKSKFSFNEVWDLLIKEKKLYGNVMKTNWYHVGDIQGLNIAKELET